MHIEKKYILNAPASEVWKLVSDPKEISRCLPGLESFEEKKNNHFIAKVKPKFSFVRGSLELDIQVVSLKNKNAKIKMSGKSIGTSFSILTEAKLKDVKGKTEVLWSADMKPGGLMKAVPESITKGAAEELADEIFSCMKKKIEGKK